MIGAAPLSEQDSQKQARRLHNVSSSSAGMRMTVLGKTCGAYLMENTSTEFPDNNVRRALACLNDPAARRYTAARTHFTTVSVSSRSALHVRSSILVTVPYSEKKRDVDRLPYKRMDRVTTLCECWQRHAVKMRFHNAANIFFGLLVFCVVRAAVPNQTGGIETPEYGEECRHLLGAYPKVRTPWIDITKDPPATSWEYLLTVDPQGDVVDAVLPQTGPTAQRDEAPGWHAR